MLDSMQSTKLINVEKSTMDKLSISVYSVYTQLLCVQSRVTLYVFT